MSTGTRGQLAATKAAPYRANSNRNVAPDSPAWRRGSSEPAPLGERTPYSTLTEEETFIVIGEMPSNV
jgi:hypothetical protein